MADRNIGKPHGTNNKEHPNEGSALEADMQMLGPHCDPGACRALP